MPDKDTGFQKPAMMAPLEALLETADRLSVVWPYMEVVVFSYEGNGCFTARSNERKERPAAEVSGQEISAYGCLDEGIDLLIRCAEEKKSYFQPAGAAKENSIAAVTPVPVYTNQNFTSATMEDLHSGSDPFTDKIHLLCFICLRAEGPALHEQERGFIEIIAAQISQYNRLYRLVAFYNSLLAKFRHDLRTPLTSISMIGGLLEQMDGDQEAQEMGQMLHAASNKMDDLLNGFKADLQQL